MKPDSADAPSPPAEGEWRTLFGGGSLDAWRGFRSSGVPAGWQVVDGALTRVGEAGDRITRDEFGDFQLALEWKVSLLYRI